jgi:putative ABC transport system substrate-binding protein
MVEQLSEFAAELVRINVDIIFATSLTEVGIVQQLTKTIPIVFATHADPIGVGHVASHSRPGGNITGLSNLLPEVSAKALEVLTEVVPAATRFGIFYTLTAPSHIPLLQVAEAVGACTLGASSRARSPLTCQSCSRPSSSWSCRPGNSAHPLGGD